MSSSPSLRLSWGCCICWGFSIQSLTGSAILCLRRSSLKRMECSTNETSYFKSGFGEKNLVEKRMLPAQKSKSIISIPMKMCPHPFSQPTLCAFSLFLFLFLTFLVLH